jgi:uncharacterized protein
MILYADTSALVKRYVQEPGSDDVQVLFDGFEAISTATLTEVEMAAAMAKAIRQGWVDSTAIMEAWQDFLSHWPAFTRIPVSTSVVERAVGLAWQHGLRAYDAIQLTCALTWQESMAEKTIFACYDKNLRRAAKLEGLEAWPEG